MRSGQHISTVVMLKVKFKIKVTKNHALLHTSHIFSARGRDVGK
jgi:hypothetical protein